MKRVFWNFDFCEYVLCDQITSVVQTIYRPDLPSASEYVKDGYNSFKQRFCTRSISFHNFLSNQDATLYMHNQEQNELQCNRYIRTPALMQYVRFATF